ncbi:hypothetical protein V6N12_069817 [Hibiscus sabdariffa]|uniref:Uncharacterized protein n=1 Tax=Hibiscus sabdariffa TaxID=183260 RepID=A0ABR2FEX7_9ROSI
MIIRFHQHGAEARALDFEGSPHLSNGVKFGQSNAYDSNQYSEEITKFRQTEFSSNNSSQSDIYGDEYSSTELSSGLLNSNKSGTIPVSQESERPKLKALNHHIVAAIVVARGTMVIVASDKCRFPELFTHLVNVCKTIDTLFSYLES